jgi:hypothetical protein
MTVNQVTIITTMKMARDIKNVARRKLASTKSMGDWEGDIVRIPSSPVEVSTDRPPDLGILVLRRAGSPGSAESPAEVAACAGDMHS